MSNMSPCLEVLTLLTLAHALELATGKAADDASEFECQQHRRCAIRRQAAAFADRIEVDRIETERGKYGVLVRFFVGRYGGRDSLASGGAKLFENVLAAFRQLRALLDEQMASFRKRRMD